MKRTIAPIIGILALLLCSQSIFSQDIGELKFTINPGHEYQVKVNGDTIWSDRFIELPVGEHQIEVWSPGYLPFDTTINVSADQTIEVFKELDMRDDYRVFLATREQSIYSHNRKVTASFVLTMVGTAYTGFHFFRMRKDYNELPELRNLYETSSLTAVVQESKVKYYNTREDFFNKRQSFRISAALTVLSAGLTFYLVEQRRKDLLPVYEDNYKPHFESVGLGLIPVEEDDSFIPSFALKFRL